MAKKKTSQQPAPVKDKPQAPVQDQAQMAAPARVTTVSLTTCLVSVVEHYVKWKSNKVNI